MVMDDEASDMNGVMISGRGQDPDQEPEAMYEE